MSMGLIRKARFLLSGARSPLEYMFATSKRIDLVVSATKAHDSIETRLTCAMAFSIFIVAGRKTRELMKEMQEHFPDSSPSFDRVFVEVLALYFYRLDPLIRKTTPSAIKSGMLSMMPFSSKFLDKWQHDDVQHAALGQRVMRYMIVDHTSEELFSSLAASTATL